MDTISGPAKRDRRSGSLVAALLLTWGIIGTGSAFADPITDAADDPPYMSGNAPEMTSGRPARGGPRAVAGRPPARGFVDWGGRPQDPNQNTPGSRPVEMNANGQALRLNFVNVELQEFARAVFDEVLHENVIVDPGVTGRITVRTSNPVPKSAAISLVREALQAAGATLSRPGNVWRIGTAPRNTGPSREAVRVIPLRFIGLNEAKQAIQPFLGGTGGGGGEVAASGTGRFLVLAGRSNEVEGLEQVVSTFDVDELRGRAFALVPLRQASAGPVAQDLLRMIGSEGSSQGVKVFPVQRMNAVMIASSSPDMIERVRQWITGLDQSGQDQRRVYVYPVRNRRAAEIAKVLDGMLQGRGRATSVSDGPAVAPGLTPQQGSLFGTNSGSRGGSSMSAGLSGPSTSGSSGLSAQFTALPSSEQGREEITSTTRSENQGSSTREAQLGIEVRADVATNTLVVVSRPEDYHIVSSAIRNLDVLPTQVLIEATIAEVRLNDALKHGVSWYFQGGSLGQGAGLGQIGGSGNGLGNSGRSVTGQGSAGNIALTYSLGLSNAKLAITELESVTDVEIVSSPALTVLDNQTATLKVGEQVPIATRSARSVVNADAPLVNDIEMKDTGVILQVTPRVNAGGLVMLDIKQEASDVVPTTTSNLDSPTIRMRQVTSTVAVKSGAEIMLGGIIQKGWHRSSGGVPGLRDLPIIGPAFNDLDTGKDRTELVIIIRPTIMANPAEVKAVTGEVKRRLRRGEPKPVLRARY